MRLATKNIAFLSVIGALLQQKAHGVGWKVESFPQPSKGVVVDPDGILSEYHISKLSEKIKTVEETARIPVQMAVAVLEKMHLPDTDEEQVAAVFARALHDKWGVGNVIEESGGGTGVLLFLSVDDRVVYISRGGSLDTLLRDSRIDSVIQKLRPSLKQAKYGEGLLLAIELVSQYIEQGEPTWKELIFDYMSIEHFVLYFYMGLIFLFFWKARRQQQEQRRYAEAASQLSEIDRAHARSLQGQYQSTSCPICLENFVSDSVGSDDKPIKLLRCGHTFDETCFDEWVHSGQGNPTKCPICRKDVGSQSLVEEASATVANTTQETTDQDRAVQLFQQDRSFRLVRLAERYPRYITPSQVQRWSSPTYNGSLSQDPSFRESRPRMVQSQQGNNGRGTFESASSSHFGGGTSSGGRGGRF